MSVAECATGMLTYPGPRTWLRLCYAGSQIDISICAGIPDGPLWGWRIRRHVPLDCKILPQELEVRPVGPLLLLQCMTEFLVELRLQQANEVDSQGQPMLWMGPQPCPDIGCLFEQTADLVSGGVHICVSQESVTEHSPGFQLLFRRLPDFYRLCLLRFK